MANRHFLIVGGSSGIGRALVDICLAQNDQVTVLSRSRGDLPDHAQLTFQSYDVTSDAAQDLDLPERLDGLVYCPGTINLKPFRALKPAIFQKDFDINVLGFVRILQRCQKALQASGNAAVVGFSTVAVAQGMPYHASVAAAKGALEGLAKSLAAEWAPQVRVNVIAPSLTDTPLAGKLLSTEEKRAASAKRHPLQRVGRPEDIASLAMHLLGEQGSWITGQVIGVDGGMGAVRSI